jgi:hypothetical protein
MIRSSLQAFVAAPQSAPQMPDRHDSEVIDPLIRLAGDIRNAHALILAEHGLDLMCGLIRRGCLAATILRVGDRPDTSDYDVVFVPRVTELASLDTVVRVARMALVPSGRLIAGFGSRTDAVALAGRLRLNGFSPVRSFPTRDAVVICADRRRLS